MTIDAAGSACVRSAGNDIGTGTYTVMQQLTAELLGLELDHVRVGLGDSAMPWAPPAGGSGLTGALGNAVHAACQALLKRFEELGRGPRRVLRHGAGTAPAGRAVRRR